MFWIGQRFRGSELADLIDLIDPWADETNVVAFPGKRILAVVPERRRSVAISLTCGRGASATSALFEDALNESLRGRRCLIPISWYQTPHADGVVIAQSPEKSLFLAAGLVVRDVAANTEFCEVIGKLSADSVSAPLVPIAVPPALAKDWIYGTAADDLIRLLEGAPWEAPLVLKPGSAVTQPPMSAADH
jgi:hypothetical protein